MTAKDLPEMGRPALGKAMLELAAGQKVQDIFRIARAVPEAEIEVQPAGKDGAGGESEDDQDGDDGATGGQAANGATRPRAKPAVEVKGPTKTNAQPGVRAPAGAAGRVPAGQKTVPPAATTGTAAPPSSAPQKGGEGAVRKSAVAQTAPKSATGTGRASVFRRCVCCRFVFWRSGCFRF